MKPVLLSAALLLICILDLVKIIDLSKKRWFIPYLILAPHLPLLCYHMIVRPVDENRVFTTGCNIIFWIAVVIFQLYTTLRLHFQLIRKGKTENLRVNIIYSGRNLIQCGLWSLYLLAFWYWLCFFLLPLNPYRQFWDSITSSMLLTDSVFLKNAALLGSEIIYAVIFIWLFLINGCLRIFFGSRNLVIGRRVFILLFMWVPFIQLYLAHIMCCAAKDEYLVTVSRSEQDAFTVTDDLCATVYPIIMVHGIGFRDLKYFNYWGRIPQILKQHGAKIYYGHQNAWGTIEDNAAAVCKVIDQALEETKSEKVNLIAHSKGGLDCRYLISSLGYADKVASLTTINTPHRGSELITILNKMPDYAYRYIANQLNKPFMLVGETEPDCYSSSKQLDPVFCETFNRENPDKDNIYYQSYASVMHNAFSDSLLSIPYLLMCTQKGRQNDGLVDVSSAEWGDFKGILKSKNNRGISHGDMIDLKREDIKGFDVLKLFYEIVANLKERGF